MELGGQAVPHGNASVRRKILNDFLSETTVLNTVVHTAEDTCGVFDGFLLAHLRATRIQVGDAHTKVHTGNLECATSTRGGLLKQQNNVLAFEVTVGRPSKLQCLELAREVDEVANFIRSEIEELEEMTSTQVNWHDLSFLTIHRKHRQPPWYRITGCNPAHRKATRIP